MTERMALAPDLDRLGRRNKELHRLRRRSGQMIEAALDRLRLAEALTAVPELMAGLTAALILLIGAREGLGTGTIAAALSALGLLLAPMRNLATVWNLHAGWRAAREKCAAALTRRQRGPYGTRGLPKGPVALRIEALELPGAPAFSFRLAAGKAGRIALGERAETALFDILLGRDPKPAGQVRMSGIPLDALSRGALRRNLCRIGADVPILQGSLRRALTFGTGVSIEDAALRDRLGQLRLKAVLCPDGDLDRRITEGGRTLSLSERTVRQSGARLPVQTAPCACRSGLRGRAARRSRRPCGAGSMRPPRRFSGVVPKGPKTPRHSHAACMIVSDRAAIPNRWPSQGWGAFRSPLSALCPGTKGQSLYRSRGRFSLAPGGMAWIFRITDWDDCISLAPALRDRRPFR
ncbi:hypothetical protein [Ponticoccus litoralis]|uniref:ABC transmembrane type-1 domain-containing protein n=1 Tax=Ponticoccus litoralis TaxID=422297 RepID=A0AAW9SF08_9RHOB